MVLIIATFVGVITALVLHWFSWYTRLNHLNLGVYLGAVAAIGVTSLGVIYLWPYPADIADYVLNGLIVIWLFSLLVGSLQARSLSKPWWKGVMSVFYELGLALLTAAGVNLTLQNFGGQFNQTFPDIPVSAFLDRFLWSLTISLAVLAVLRPLVRRRRWRAVPRI